MFVSAQTSLKLLSETGSHPQQFSDTMKGAI